MVSVFSFRFRLIAAGALFCLCAQALARPAVERLEYLVSYQGALSAGEVVPIADVTLGGLAPEGAAGLREMRLEATSSAYPLVESLYPIRYRLRTWLNEPSGRMVGFETFEDARRHRHRLYLRDAAVPGVRRYRLDKGAGSAEMAELEAGRAPLTAGSEDLLDRLGMLQRLRGERLYAGASYRYSVTSGRDRFSYRVGVEAAEVLDLAGVSVPAWKLRLDGFEERPDGTQTASHRAAYLWLSQGPSQVPLRVDSRHPIGLFQVELRGWPGATGLARSNR